MMKGKWSWISKDLDNPEKSDDWKDGYKAGLRVMTKCLLASEAIVFGIVVVVIVILQLVL